MKYLKAKDFVISIVLSVAIAYPLYRFALYRANYVQSVRGDLMDLTIKEAILTNHIGYWLTLKSPEVTFLILSVFVCFPWIILFAYSYRKTNGS